MVSDNPWKRATVIYAYIFHTNLKNIIYRASEIYIDIIITSALNTSRSPECGGTLRAAATSEMKEENPMTSEETKNPLKARAIEPILDSLLKPKRKKVSFAEKLVEIHYFVSNIEHTAANKGT